MGRAPCCDKATVKKGPWSPEEDAMLKNYIEEHGTGGNWIALPHKIGLKRCGKSCRLRWLNYLRPNIKHGDFTPEEDSIICSLYISIGSRWSIIAAQLPGRTDNDVKNYWNTKLKKRLLGRRKDRDTQQQQHNHHRPSAAAVAANEASAEDNNTANNNNGSDRSLSASAMERIQLCMQLQELQNPLGAAIHTPLMWPTCRATNTQSNNTDNSSNNNNNNVTVAEPGHSSISSLNEHLNAQLVESSAAMDGGLVASPSSTDNSNDVINIEAELQELLYGEADRQVMMRAGAIDDGTGIQQQGDMMDWWGYDQSKPAVNCWEFITPEPNSVFQDYASVYDV